MKKTIIAVGILCTSLFYSCTGDGWSELKTYQSVRKKFPKARIYHEGDSKTYYWIVLDTNGQYYRVVTGKGSSSEITQIQIPIELK